MSVAVATNKNAVRRVPRPLKVLVPMIQEELIAGTEAGLAHYLKAGRMLNEARELVTHGNWYKWLKDNFHLSRNTASDYMRLARKADEDPDFKRNGTITIDAALGREREPRVIKSVTRANKLKALFDNVEKVNVGRLAEERQSRDDEIKLHREMARKLIDLGYRAMATRLHPDQGGSRDAMSRLNTVRDELKEFAATRRFI